MSQHDQSEETEETSPARKALNIVLTILVGLLFAGLIVVVILKWNDMMGLFANEGAGFRKWIDGLGFWAPLVFTLIQFAQVVIFVIPGEVPQLVGGYVFGVALGTVYSVVGIGLGSAFCFIVARKLGLAFVQRIFGKKQIAGFERFISSPRAQMAFFLLYLIPGLPKDILGYIAGLSYMRLGVFMLISMIARLPSLIGSMFVGNAIKTGDWTVIIIIGSVAVVLFGIGVLFRKQITAFLSNNLPPEAKAQPAATTPDSSPNVPQKNESLEKGPAKD